MAPCKTLKETRFCRFVFSVTVTNLILLLLWICWFFILIIIIRLCDDVSCLLLFISVTFLNLMTTLPFTFVSSLTIPIWWTVSAGFVVVVSRSLGWFVARPWMTTYRFRIGKFTIYFFLFGRKKTLNIPVWFTIISFSSGVSAFTFLTARLFTYFTVATTWATITAVSDSWIVKTNV